MSIKRSNMRILMSRNNQGAGVKKDFHNETSALVRMSHATLNMFTSEQ